MTPVSYVAGPAVVLDIPNLDCDRLLPPRFLDRPNGDALMHDLRTADPAFPLRPDGNPPILLAGANFGCGASREAAVLALLDAGVRCIIAPGFGGTFRADATRNGLLAVVLAPDAFSDLLANARSGASIAVDLERERVRCAGFEYRFRMERFARCCLLDGLDELALTLDSATADAIDRFEGADARRRPWATPT